MSYPNNLTFADYAGKKTYTCKKCNKELRYIKFFKPDGKILTLDDKEPNGLYGKESNVFSTSVLSLSKELHTCYEIKWPTESEPIPKTDSLSEIDQKVKNRMVEDAYQDAKMLIYIKEGVEKACAEFGIERGAVSGMIFNNLCASRRVKE